MKSESQTTMSWEKDGPTGDLVFSGRVSHFDFQRLDLDKLDRMVVSSLAEKASDILQSLEIIYRRMEEQCLTKQ